MTAVPARKLKLTAASDQQCLETSFHLSASGDRSSRRSEIMMTLPDQDLNF